MFTHTHIYISYLFNYYKVQTLFIYTSNNIFISIATKDRKIMIVYFIGGITFAEIAQKYLRSKGFEPYLCDSEDEARALIEKLPEQGKWPCLFKPSNTTGEKDFEEFFTLDETIDLNRFQNLGVVKNGLAANEAKLNYFLESISKMRRRGQWTKEEIMLLEMYLFKEVPSFISGTSSSWFGR